jgi:hypothetical protein
LFQDLDAEVVSRNAKGMAEGEPVFFGLLLLFVVMVIVGILGNLGYFGPM